MLLVLAPLAISAIGAELTSVYNFDGNANYIRNRKTYPIALDIPCKDGDLLRVETGGFVDLSMNGIAGTRLSEESECLIVSTKSSNMHFFLHAGMLTANVKLLSTGSAYQVETAHTLAVSTGGQFVVRILSDSEKGPTTRFTVKKGQLNVYVKESSVTVTVLDGQTLDVPTASFIPAVRPSEEDEKLLAYKAMGVYIDNPDA